MNSARGVDEDTSGPREMSFSKWPPPSPHRSATIWTRRPRRIATVMLVSSNPGSETRMTICAGSSRDIDSSTPRGSGRGSRKSGMLESRNLYTSPSPSPSTDSSTAPPSASSTSTTGLGVPNELLRLTLSKPPWWGNVYDELLPAPVLRLDDDEQMDDESESRIQRPFAAG